MPIYVTNPLLKCSLWKGFSNIKEQVRQNVNLTIINGQTSRESHLISRQQIQVCSLLNKCESCSLKSVVVTVAGPHCTGESPQHNHNFHLNIQPRRSSANKPQVCKGRS